ncbi:MAG: tRNA dihydrouridine(20/20a) synthase DusA [Pseudomonadales bacterium]
MIARPLPDASLCVAPMMAWTDRHCRYLHRLFAPHALLFTEMVTAHALLHGDARKLLQYNPEEHPVALQLGGSEPDSLAAAALLAADAGYDEINLNVGCPSDRVQRGRFGACLMREPELVARCLRAMQDAVQVPVTVKCRLGVDELDSDAELSNFIGILRDAGLPRLYLHARKAILSGLSPAQNRQIPPLQYERVYTMAQQFPSLPIVVNGGIACAEDAMEHLTHVEGVMIGRAAYQNPTLLAELSTRLHKQGRPSPTAHQVIELYRTYVVNQLADGVRLGDLCRPLLGVYHAVPGARQFRRILSNATRLRANDPKLLDDALNAVQQAA